MKETAARKIPPYVVAVASIGLALGLRFLVDPALGERQPFVTFYLAIAVTAWFGGLWPALAVTVVGYIVASWFFISPRHELPLLHPGLDDVVITALYCLVGVAIAGVTESMRRAEWRLGQSEARFKGLIGSATDAIISIDAEQKIVVFNAAAETIFGYPTSEMIGQSLDRLLPARFRDAHRGHVDAFGATGAGARQMGGERVLVGLHRDGSEFPIEAHISHVTVGAEKLYTVILRDVTDRMRTQALLAANLGAMQRVHDISSHFVRERDLNSLLAKILDAAIETARADFGNIQLVNPTTRLLEIVAQRGFRREFLDFFSVVRDDEGTCGAAKSAHSRVVVEDVHTDPIFQNEQLQGVMRSADVRAVQSTPLFNRNGELVGMLSIHFRVPHWPTDDELRFVDVFAQQAADIVEQVRAEQGREELLAIAERARAEAEVAVTAEHDARKTAEVANRAKDAFLATVSHELRAPLSPILAWSRMLRQGVLDAEKTARAVDTIERSAKFQAQLIDDLLDVSRIVAGRMRLEVRPVDLVPVIQAAVAVVRPAVEAKSVRLQVVLDSEVGMISGDAERLQQVVWNLLSNAVKFTPKGGRIDVVLERVNSHVEIAVTDSGMGISAEFLPRVFERFEQAERGSSRAHGGLGLGLAIVRHIVELHGGTVHAESPGEGKGAVLTVKLPTIQIAREAGEATRRHPTVDGAPDGVPYPSLAGLRALVVDDDPDSNETVRVLLGSCGADVRVAGSAAQAREVLGRWKPDVLVSDIGMPGEDGYGLIASVRARDMELPAIALTAYATVEDRVRLLAAGYQAHVTKPLDPAELAAVVASVTRSVRKL